ncbi:MAG TPA: ketoacyl-ACP synthase III [Flavobacterium sp.]|nr:ketoacyl-ACP synthase III [Flavobacterium sp.]
MVLGNFKDIRVAGVSVAVPSKRYGVENYHDAFGADVVAKFTEMTGVASVCRAVPEQTASDLGYEAAHNLFSKSDIDPSEIGMLVFVSQKPDYRSPSTAFLLHKRLGLPASCSCFDINLACSGFVYGLQTTLSMLRASDAKKALLITADTSIKTLAPEDRTMVMLFGDSGSAVVLEKQAGAPPISIGMRSDGSRFKSIITPSGAYRNVESPTERVEWSDGIKRSDFDTHMKGMEVFGFSIKDVPQLLQDFLTETQTQPDTYDYFTLHQANMYILKQISRKLKLPFDKIPVSLDRFGNNSSNSVPLVLADHFGTQSGRSIRTLMAGFGAGLSWACADVTIDTDVILPLHVTDAFATEAQLLA